MEILRKVFLNMLFSPCLAQIAEPRDHLIDMNLIIYRRIGPVA